MYVLCQHIDVLCDSMWISWNWPVLLCLLLNGNSGEVKLN